MLFPDSFFFAERRLLNHKIETKYVKDLDHCELFCYMNDNCVSANFKKDPEDGRLYVPISPLSPLSLALFSIYS